MVGSKRTRDTHHSRDRGARRTLAARHLQRWHEAFVRSPCLCYGAQFRPNARSLTYIAIWCFPLELSWRECIPPFEHLVWNYLLRRRRSKKPAAVFHSSPEQKVPNPNETRVWSSTSAHTGGRLSFGRLATSCSKPGVFGNIFSALFVLSLLWISLGPRLLLHKNHEQSRGAMSNQPRGGARVD